MWVDGEAEVRTRMRDREQEAEHERQAAGFGLVRTGLRLLDGGRA
jgi:hypothetical protein